MATFSIRQTVSAVTIAQNTTTVLGTFEMANLKSVSVQMTKTGAATGTAKLQWTNDGTLWTDVNTTLQPNATFTVTGGANTIALLADNVPGAVVRVLMTESNTGTGSITGGKWFGKIY